MASAGNKSMLFSRWAVAAVMLGTASSPSFAEETSQPAPNVPDVCSMDIASLPSADMPMIEELPAEMADHLRKATNILGSYFLDDAMTQSLLDTEAVFSAFLNDAFQGEYLTEIKESEIPKILGFKEALETATDKEPWDKFNSFDLPTRALLLEKAVGGINAYFSILDPDMAYESGLVDEIDGALAPISPYVSPEYSQWDPAGCGTMPDPLPAEPEDQKQTPTVPAMALV